MSKITTRFRSFKHATAVDFDKGWPVRQEKLLEYQTVAQ